MDSKTKEKVRMQNKPFVIKPTKILAGAVAIYENVWDNHKETIDCAESVTLDLKSGITFVPSQTSKDTATGDPFEQSIRTNYCLDLIPASKISTDIKIITDQYSKLIFETLKGYIDIFDIHESIKVSEDFGLLKYSSGEYYHSHYDGGTESGRSVSAILYLNDDYQGGEIEFANFNLTIKPKAGTFILFPSNYAYTHTAKPILSGTKYAIVTWLHDR